jgi:hypothetical protein
MKPSEPLATTCGLVESGKDPAHAPDPPNPVTFTVEHVTFTADTGTVGQLVNVDDEAWAVRFQLLPDPMALHDAVAVALPATTGTEPGLVAAKLMVAGVTLRVKFPVA